VRTIVQKWGNSLGLRIPKSFAEEAFIAEGTPVDLSISNGGLFIRPSCVTEYSLESLVRRITKANLHEETSFGEPEGRESW
jgi:antitoxin MazE